MALIVEDGTGKPDAQSYVSVADADAILAARGYTAWAGYTEAQKEARLINAAAYIDGAYAFTGTTITKTQALSWPRTGAYTSDGWAIDIDEIPAAVKAGQCLAALEETLLETLDRGGLVQSETVGPVSVTYANGAPAGKSFPQITMALRSVLGRSLQGKTSR